MITLIALLIFLKIAYNIWTDRVFDDFLEKLGFTAITLFLTFFIIFVTLVMFNQKVEISRQDCSAPVYSLKNEQGIEGDFCLGSGRISSVEYYYLFGKNNDGGFYRIQIPANQSIIYMDEQTTPIMKWQKATYRIPYWVNFCWPKYTWEQDLTYNVHVPTNTIVQKFSVN